MNRSAPMLVVILLAGCWSDQQAASEVSSVDTAASTSGVPRTADEFYAQFTADDIAGFGGPECAAELAVISAAFQVFVDREQRQPVSYEEFADDLERPITLWVFGADDSQMLLPSVGSPCILPMITAPETQPDSCDQNLKDLETANQAYYAENGSYPGSQQDLLDAGMIRDEKDGFTVAGGSVVPDVGSACDALVAVPATMVATPEDCTQDLRTLEVAIAAYQAQFGSLPDNERVLIDAGMIRTSFDTYDVVYGEIVSGDGSPCS